MQCGILAAILLNSGAADYVVTGCGTGEGAMLALNSFPGVICGHVEDPVDAYTFAHVNDGNAVAMPFAKGFGWGGELNLEYCFEKLFGFGHGQGYPKERVEPEQRNKKILDGVRAVTMRPLVDVLGEIDQDLVKGALAGEHFQEYFFANATDEAIINVAFRDAKAGHTHYGDPKGDPELISAGCKAWEEDFDQSLPRDHVLVSASSCLGMSLAMFAILDPGDEVIVFSPYFALYRAQIELAGGVCVDVPTYAEEDYAISEERLRAAITPRTKAIIFNNPTNPTGMGYDLSTMEMLARVAKEYDLLIAADEIYTTYIYEGDFRPIRTLPGMAERTITLNSFSKNFLMTGWRVGVIIAEPEFLDVMNRINGSLVYSAPSISQRAGIQALAMRKEIREKYVTAYRDRIFYSADRIEKIPYLSLVRPKGTFYLFPGVEKTGLDDKQFCKELLERAHVLVSAGSPFGKTGANHFRIACTVGIDQLKQAFDRMEKLEF